ADIPNARIEIDGRRETEGLSTPIDPGPHVLRVRAEGYAASESSVVAREGEQNRVIQIKLARGADAPPPSTAKRDRPLEPPPDAPKPIPTITWVTGGLAVLALGSFAFFGLTGRSDAADLRAS